ncbi:unnamed protein product [Echinostoma caproni]|uniref:Pecanex-like protein n=1 Tax=Echinostoma caproni TaxID=27848 RepID=A0A183AGE6_9TREM|nr:unnamed protein product [Echinostoma caproni]
MKRRWSPANMPQLRSQLTGPHADLIHACSFARCGILFYKNPIPSDILFAFFYQLDNLFSMSKVIHTIRSIMDWLDASENRAFQERSIYEMHLQIPVSLASGFRIHSTGWLVVHVTLSLSEQNFIGTLSDHLKALKLCDQLLRHLGSVYHRVRPEQKMDPFAVRAIVDYCSRKGTVNMRANQWYQVVSNTNPHVWKLDDPTQLVPSIFLEASTKGGEERMLRRLQKRFDDFLIMCHGRSRRQLFSRITKQLQKNNKVSRG